MRFLGLQLEHKVPDANTVWLFRERMRALNLEKVLFDRFHEQLARHGYVAHAGQMIDATFVEAPKQRNPREENTIIKADAVPVGWTKKNDEKHYGYKNHINADQAHKLVQDFGAQMQAMFEKDLESSKPITLENWRSRSITTRIKERAARLWSHWL